MRHSTSLLQPFFLAALLLTSPVRADNAAEADKLFKEARALTKAGKLAEACPKYEASFALDPSAGAAFRLGECYEATRRPAKAWEMYQRAAGLAKGDQRDDRKAQALERANLLLPHIALVNLILAPSTAAAPGLSMKRDREPMLRLTGRVWAFMPGRHTIEVTAPGYGYWRRAFEVSAGDLRALEIPPLELGSTSEPREPEQPNQQRANPAIVITGTTLAVLGAAAGVGMVVGSFVYSRRVDDAKEQCKNLTGCALANVNGLSSDHTRVLLANASIAALISAGTIGVSTLIYALVARRGPNAKPTMKVDMSLSLQGVQIQGCW